MYYQSNLKKTIGILILLLIVFSCLTLLFTKVFALDEWIDNYQNENYVQNKFQVIRNNTLDCMELEYNGTAIKIYENFTTYTELDPTSTRIIFISDYEIEFDAYRNEDAYLYYDYGNGFFTNFTIEEDIRTPTVKQNNAVNYYFCLGNTVNDWSGLRTTDAIGVCYRYMDYEDGKGWVNSLRLECYDDGALKYDYYGLLSLNTWYYLIIKRQNDDVSCEVYSDQSRTTLIDKLWCNNSCPDALRYVYSCNTLNTGDNIYSWNSRSKNLWLGNYSGGYEDFGFYITKNIMNGINGSSIVLLYYCDIPSGDSITIQFSPNNSSWYDHNNQTSNYDYLIDGNESLDMRDLNYIGNSYLWFNFTDGGPDSTPRIFQLRLITSANVTGGGPGPSQGGGVGFVIGGWILIPPILLIISAVLKRGRK